MESTKGKGKVVKVDSLGGSMMGKVINLEVNQKEATVNVVALAKNRRKLQAGMIAPADEEVVQELAIDHSSDPIKSIEDIRRISELFLSRGEYRNNMLFIVGINFGLRISDLLSLRFSNLIDDEYRFKTNIAILEQKTKNTRAHKKNRYITINDAVMDAVTLYLEHTPGVKLSDYMFRSESNRGGNLNQPMTRYSVERILKRAAAVLGIEAKVATHTLRKTFAYHQMMMSGNDPRKLLLLQKMFGHSTSAITLDYIGITKEEMEDAYRNFNLGYAHCCLIEQTTIA